MRYTQGTCVCSTEVDEARVFSDIVVQIVGAERPADFVAGRASRVEAVVRREKIFSTVALAT